MSLHPGMMITPSLKLVRQIGEGGMGSVWEAEHLTLKARVAVKCLSATMLNNAEAKARFEREALAAAQIRSPHVVQVLDHGFASDGTPFIALEMLDGVDLNTRLHRVKQLDLDELGRIISQTCKALSKAHSLGVVHRDIKPDNIFITDVDGEPFAKILDFGIAKRREDRSMGVTSTGVMIGTPYYMSPEQVLSSKDVDFRADLWSLAVVAYHCLTGRRPFEGETIGALCIAIDKGRYAPPSTLRPGLPTTLDRFFEKALTRNPDDRFSSAREMEAEFLSALAGLPAGSRTSLNEISAARSLSIPPAWMAASGGVPASQPPPSTSEPLSQPTLSGQTVARGGSRARRTAVPVIIGVGMLVAGVGGWLAATRGTTFDGSRASAMPPSASAFEPPAASASASSAPAVANVDDLPRAPSKEEAKAEEKKAEEKKAEEKKAEEKRGDDKKGEKKPGSSPPKKVKDRGF